MRLLSTCSNASTAALFPHRSRRSRGIALVWVVLTFLVVLGLVGLGIDTARVTLASHELQDAADSSALAAALYVTSDTAQARQAAINAASANVVEGSTAQVIDNPDNVADGGIVIGWYDQSARTFTPTLSSPNAVKVTTKRSSGDLPLIFGPIFGVSTSSVQSHAIAMNGGLKPAGIIALSTSGIDLSMKGTPAIDVTNDGAVWINSSASNSVNINSNSATITAGELDTSGGTSLGTSNYAGTIHTGVSPVPDPLAYLPAPDWQNMPVYSYAKNTTATLSPGYYPGGIVATSNTTTITLQPGVYALDGAGLDVNGGNLYATQGVMFYIKGTGVLNLGGNGVIQINPLDTTTDTNPADAIYEGMAIFQDRSDTQPASLGGTNVTDAILGTIYVPDAQLTLNGGADLTIGNQIIAYKIQVTGNSTITVQYDGRNPVKYTRVFLVQ